MCFSPILHFLGLSGHKAGRAAVCGAIIPVGPAHWSEDAGARLGPRDVGEAAAAGAAPHPEAAADPETATHQRVPEAAWKVDPSAPGSAPGTPQGRYRTAGHFHREYKISLHSEIVFEQHITGGEQSIPAKQTGRKFTGALHDTFLCLLTGGVQISQLQQELQAMKKQQELAEKERRLEQQQQQQQQNQQEKEQERHRREQHVSSLVLRGKERSRESKGSPPSSTAPQQTNQFVPNF